MKIQLLIALEDNDYAEFLSSVLAERYSDTFDVAVCSSLERLRGIALERRYDITLIEPAFAEQVQFNSDGLKLLIWDGTTSIPSNLTDMGKLAKYQRISSLVSDLLERYALVSDHAATLGGSRARVTVAWSPIGGCGKTSAALAYATQRVSEGKRVVYLDLQVFAGSTAFFSQSGKSTSTALGHMDGNLPLLLQSILQKDSGSGIGYFGIPENYDDIAILSAQDVRVLVENCATGIDELVVDLSCTFDDKTKLLLDMADVVLMVVGPTAVGQAKWQQFLTQNNIFEMIRSKTVLVANQGAKMGDVNVFATVALPQVQSGDPVVVYKTLSAGYFQF